MGSSLSMDELFQSDQSRNDGFKRWRREYLGWPHKELDGAEKEQMLTILKMKEVDEVDASNQQSVTERYTHEGKRYDLTDFGNGEYIIQEECTWEDLGL